jgi:predicted ribosome quality control (RQC) complex YloA/Tae2 family protein
LAAAIVAEAAPRAFVSSAEQATWLAGRAADVVAEAERAALSPDDLHVYRDAAGELIAVHLVPLAQYAALAHARAPSLLPLFAESRTRAQRRQLSGAVERRRTSLAARVERRARATAAESSQLETQFADADGRERLRLCGDALYTHAHEIEPGATSFVPSTNPTLTVTLDPELDAKANARRYYARYRKAAAALPHLEKRRDTLRRRVEALDELRFEIERADAATLLELEADLDALEGRAPRRAAAPARKRAPLRFERPSGARIYVGRSPRENAEVTFRIARPDDLWFHARGVPGSHVVLALPAGRQPLDDDLAAAANLAAAHSKARGAAKVEIDFTERKHVRKQRDGGPGLVWYTHARTRVGSPHDVPAPEA